MNLVLHGLFLQVIVSIVQYHHGSRLCSAAEPGYLDFDNLPETNFSCQGKVIGGYYADVEAGCQMFHVCTIGQKDEIMDIKFLCLNGTVFDQETRVCERVDEVDCSKSEMFYNLNLELYGNNAVTHSIHDLAADEDDFSHELVDDPHESQRTTSSRPSTTSTSTTTTQRPIISSTTSASGAYQHPNGYPQHYQPQPRFPSVQTSQSKSLYDDKNGGYHHQYIYHTGDHRNNNLENNNNNNNENNNNHNHNNNNNNNHNNNEGNVNQNRNNQATSYQIFSNQGVSSTTGSPQIHQIRYSSTAPTQIQIRNDHQPTLSPIFHATSSTIQTLLNSNANSPALINPIFHSHGIASTTEQYNVHNNNPRETEEYHDDDVNDEEDEDIDDDIERRPLEAIQPTTQGKVSKLKISPIPEHEEVPRNAPRNKDDVITSQQQRITTAFLPTASNDPQQSVRSFYPTPRTSTKSSSSHVTQHIHLPPPPSIPHLKPHQVTINLSPPDIQRIVQNPSPLLPSQSRVIVTAKASVSDESGRSLNTTQLVTLPLPTIPASYDDYKEGDESFDPFYRDVPKIRSDRRIGGRFRWPARDTREKRSMRAKREITIDRIGETSTRLNISKENGEEQEKIVDVEGLKVSKSDVVVPEVIDDLRTMSSKHGLEERSEENIDDGIIDDERINDEEDYDEEVDTRTEESSQEMEEYIAPTEETFDDKLFEEPESQTSKEVDTRAVAQGDSKYAKHGQNTFGKSVKGSTNSRIIESTGKIVDDESSRFSLELPEVIESVRSKGKHETKRFKVDEPEVDEERKYDLELEEKVSEGARTISSEENTHDDYYYDDEMDSSRGRSNEEDSAEYSRDSRNRINSSRRNETSDRENIFHEQRKTSNNENEDDYDFPDYSTTRSSEETASFEMSHEYVDREEMSQENSREIQDDEDNSSRDQTTISQDSFNENFHKITTTTEKLIIDSFVLENRTLDESTISGDKESDGVLKFTDDIPISDKIDEPEETKKPSSPEEIAQDYIDDNYEPQSYKENEEYSSTTENGVTRIMEDESTTLREVEDEKEDAISTTLANPIEMGTVLKDEDKEKSDKEDYNDGNRHEDKEKHEKGNEGANEEEHLKENKENEKQNDQFQLKTDFVDEDQLEKSMKKPVDHEKTSSTTEDTSTTEILATTIPTTTTTTSTTEIPITTTTETTTTTTTTPRPTTTTTTTPRPTTTTPRPTSPKLFKPFTLRKTYAYVPPTTTPVPVIIKPRFSLLNPKPSKPLKSYNDLAPKPVIRKSSLFARKTSTTHRTTPRSENPEYSREIPQSTKNSVTPMNNLVSTTEIPISTTDNSMIKSFAISNTKIPTMESPDLSSMTFGTLSSSGDDEISKKIEENLSTVKTDVVGQTFTPYPLLRMTEASIAKEKILDNFEEATGEEIARTNISDVENNDVPNPSESGVMDTTTTEIPIILGVTKADNDESISISTEKQSKVHLETTSVSTIFENNVPVIQPQLDIPNFTTIGQEAMELTTKIPEFTTTFKNTEHPPTFSSVRSVIRKPGGMKRVTFFNCLEKDMYRFYADGRDCRLFHYCSPGFTSRQVLDFRFVCEEGTAFDEESQSCVHDLKNPKCQKRVW